MNIVSAEAFVRRNTELAAVPLVPEVRLHLADDPYDIWFLVKQALGGEVGLPLPYWAFAWAGGQALARYVLDTPEVVRDRAVLDLAAGSGLVRVAADLEWTRKSADQASRDWDGVQALRVSGVVALQGASSARAEAAPAG